MRYLAAFVAALALAACTAAPVTPTGPRKADAAVVEFLISSAAADFHAHRPPDPVSFRDVRVGRLLKAGGEGQDILCGQFLPRQEGGAAEWTAFATIRTSGYEQWLGIQAAGFCRSPSITWDEAGDLAPALQGRLDSLR